MAELPPNPTDDEMILAHYREQHSCIDMTTARGLYNVRRKFHHLRIAAEQKWQAVVEEERRRLRARAFGQ